MTYDDALAERVRDWFGDAVAVTEKRMFGGLVFLTDGKITVGVHGDDLTVRVGADRAEAALSRPGVHEFAITGRPMNGWVVVAGEYLDDADLDGWISAASEYVATLPPARLRLAPASRP